MAERGLRLHCFCLAPSVLDTVIHMVPGGVDSTLSPRNIHVLISPDYYVATHPSVG